MSQSGEHTEDSKELREKLAAIEHERWSDWQKWCHEVIRSQAGIIPSVEAVLHRWDKQITTPYKYLSDNEKASDMEQVDRYWPLIEAHTQRKVIEALEELKRRWHEDRKTMDYSPATYDFIADKMINELKGKL